MYSYGYLIPARGNERDSPVNCGEMFQRDSPDEFFRFRSYTKSWHRLTTNWLERELTVRDCLHKFGKKLRLKDLFGYQRLLNC